jgi:outer membrane protein assembly factor BamB
VAVAVSAGRVFTAGDVGAENFLFALSEADGRVLWSSRVGKAGAPGWGGFAGPRCTPAVDGGVLYFIGQYGEVVSLEAATGKELWRKHMAKATASGANCRSGVSASRRWWTEIG